MYAIMSIRYTYNVHKHYRMSEGKASSPHDTTRMSSFITNNLLHIIGYERAVKKINVQCALDVIVVIASCPYTSMCIVRAMWIPSSFAPTPYGNNLR